jgi:preprotein translocase subunit SecD
MDTQTNQTIVSFSLDRVGAKRFGKATSTGIGKQLAIVLDGKIISAPVVRDTIASGNGQISGGFTFQSATDLALLLRIWGITCAFKYYRRTNCGSRFR